MTIARSTQLAAERVTATGSHTVFTAPADRVTLLKSIVLSNNSGSATTIYIWVLPAAASGSVCVLTKQTSMAADTTVYLPLWVVLLDGDVVQTFTSAQPIDVLLSGALLA